MLVFDRNKEIPQTGKLIAMANVKMERIYKEEKIKMYPVSVSYAAGLSLALKVRKIRRNSL
jgi:hypothetical protein